MGKIIASYLVKLTVRSDDLDDPGLTNEQVGKSLEEALADALSAKAADALEASGAADGDYEFEVNATSVERTDV